MQKRIVYFDVLRAISISAVIVLHLSAVYFQTDVNSFTWEISSILNSLSRYAVPVFVMISGALFLNPSTEINIKKLYSKNIKHILTALVFWSFCYSSAIFLFGADRGNISKSFENLIFGYTHLWFLYMLAGLYIIVPFLRTICRDKQLVCYFLIISIIFSFLPTTITKILTGLDISFSACGFNRFASGLVLLINERFCFHFTMGYAAYFVLGYYAHSAVFSRFQRILIYCSGICGWLFTVLFTSFVSHKLNAPFEIFHPMNLNVALQALAVFVFFKYNTCMLPAWTTSLCTRLSEYIFGIYLVHAGLQACILKFLDIYTISINPVYIFIPAVMIIFLLSWIITAVIKHIPFVNKHIV